MVVTATGAFSVGAFDGISIPWGAVGAALAKPAIKTAMSPSVIWILLLLEIIGMTPP
jgi:hypothetical protein